VGRPAETAMKMIAGKSLQSVRDERTGSQNIMSMGWDIQGLFRLHAKGIARSLMRRGMSGEAAADITQDTFERVLVRQPKLEGATNNNPKAYLYRVSRNLGINQIRRDALIRTVDLDSEEAREQPDPSPSPEHIVYSRQCLLQTYRALEQLPARTRTAFEIHRLGERTIAEVGEELGISTTRAWTLIHQAYRHLLSATEEE